jgi:hypothetical protein
LTRQNIPVALIVILVFGYALGQVPGLIIAAVALGVVYVVSLRRHPRILHRTCSGTGRTHDWLFTWVYRRCRGCGGSGRMIRYGAARWGQTHIRQEASTLATARKTARQARTWR